MSEPVPPASGALIDGQDDDMLAAELALGLLDGQTAHALARRRLREARFDRAVEAWEDLFDGLNRDVAPVAPPPEVWDAVRKRAEAGGAVVELRLRRSLAVWRAMAAGAGALAAALALVLIWPRSAGPPAEGRLVAVAARPNTAPFERVMTARMVGARGPIVFVAVVDPQSHIVVVTPANVAAARGRSPELWLIPAGGKPIALGLAAFGRSVRLNPKVDIGDLARAVLAVSEEPLGGSPTGQPTGPVVATGPLEGA